MAVLRKLKLMHKLFGDCQGHTCRECSNFLRCRHHDRPLRKCSVYGDTGSEASDWAGRWLACGMFNKAHSGAPVIRMVQREKREPAQPAEPLEGQMALEV